MWIHSSDEIIVPQYEFIYEDYEFIETMNSYMYEFIVAVLQSMNSYMHVYEFIYTMNSYTYEFIL
jgi:hypothetical protein